MSKMVVLVAVLALAGRGNSQSPPDHLQCFKVKDTQAKSAYVADLDGLALDAGCTVKVPATLACVPSHATGVAPVPPGEGAAGPPVTAFGCYKLRCPKRPASPPFTLADRFGDRTVTPGASKLVCAPAGVTTTVVTSTTSTTTQPCPGCEGIAPDIATFTATASVLMPDTATTVMWTWTYATVPSPEPTCTIDGTVGTMTSGGTSVVTLSQARTFRLRCENTEGSSFRDVTIGVDECAGDTHDCGPNATCTDTLDGFTCVCNSGYVASGDVCSVTGVSCGSCPSNAACVGGSTCVCNTGYVGDGFTCTRARLTFVTNSTGTGNLSTWLNAGFNTALAAADTVCQTEATNAALPGSYVAWMSDSTNDAYCRVHGLTGKKANNCGLGALPVAVGPWVRTDTARTPAAPTIENLLAPTRQTFYPVSFTAGGTNVAGTGVQLVHTGTDETGVFAGSACADWTSTGGMVAMGVISGGGTSWTDQGTDQACSTAGRLRCVEIGSGPELPSRHPAGAKKAFVTSVAGGAVFGTWPDAGPDVSGLDAADAICQARARHAGYANATSFRAWMSGDNTSASSRITNNGPWYRPDGIRIAINKTELTDGRIDAPLYLTEMNEYVAGNAETGTAWTGSYSNGTYYGSSTDGHCDTWTSTSYSVLVGRHDLSDFQWLTFGSSTSTPSLQPCSATNYRIYCLEDTP